MFDARYVSHSQNPQIITLIKLSTFYITEIAPECPPTVSPLSIVLSSGIHKYQILDPLGLWEGSKKLITRFDPENKKKTEDIQKGNVENLWCSKIESMWGYVVLESKVNEGIT